MRTELTRILAFHDTAGENFKTKEGVAAHGPFLNHCDALIVIIDGDRIMPSFNGSGGGLLDDHVPAIQNVIGVLERLPDKSLAKIPVALCVNKVDLLQGNRGFFNLTRPDMKPQHMDKFDVRRVTKRSQLLIEGLKRKPQTAAIVSLIEQHFPNYMAFPMATIGYSKKAAHERIPQVDNAYCVEDPLLWLLWQWGMLPPLKSGN